MAKVKAELELDEAVLARVNARAAATGRGRDEVVEEALRRQLAGDEFAAVLDAVRGRSGLSEDEALDLAYRELKAMRAERRAAS